MTRNQSLQELLGTHKACKEAVDWAKAYRTPSAAWEACNRVDWMLWAINALDISDPKKNQLFACACVRETPLPDGRKVWDLLTDERSRRAVEVGELFANGQATEAARSAARSAALSAWLSAWSAAARSAAAGATQCEILRRIYGNPFSA